MLQKSVKQYLEYLKLSGIQDIFFKPPKVKKIKKKPPPQIFDPAQKLKELEEKYHNCKKCPLWEGRNKFCYGNGNPQAKLMLIGEGPGVDENRAGKVFVGKAGQLLTKMLHAIKLTRDEVYIANIVKCRPPENRNPLPEEKIMCLPYLEEQISIIKPQILLLLGRVAAATLLEMDIPLKALREQTYSYKGIKTYVSYHPAALLRNIGWKKFAWIDLQKVQKDYQSL
ncbi:MAG: uracil-DNA glycosylase [Candidatus Cloacimonetes bacterium]|nr:uracil-DNA glycosylase [Candidatus Cloacimonadota bacterium]